MQIGPFTQTRAVQTVTPEALQRWQGFWQAVDAGQYPAFAGALQPLPSDVLTTLRGWGEQLTDVLWLGLGGSTLGAQALQQFINPAGVPRGPRVHFLDHLCPTALADLLVNLPCASTGVVAISKSGTTLETTTQLGLIEQAFAAAQQSLQGKLVAVTEPTDNPLRRMAKQHGGLVVDHDPNLGGRYSVFGPTGQLLLALRGQDVQGFLEGARASVATVRHAPDSVLQSAAAMHGAKLPMHVIYAYGQPIKLVPFWWCQLWAESLGKQGMGIMPIPASGPADQHSVQQLFMGGPQDKFYTVLVPTSVGQGPAVPGQPAVGTLQLAMAEGTLAALSERGRMVRVVRLNDRNLTELGALLVHAMLEVVAMAAVQHVNPFDQPDVEASKQAARAALQRLVA